MKDFKKIIGILVVSYVIFAGIVAWLVWDSLKQNGFTGSDLYIRFGSILGIFVLLSAVEFWMKYRMGMMKTLILRSTLVGAGVGVISFIMGYDLSKSAMWAIVFGVIYYFWDRSKAIRMSKLEP